MGAATMKLQMKTVEEGESGELLLSHLDNRFVCLYYSTLLSPSRMTGGDQSARNL